MWEYGLEIGDVCVGVVEYWVGLCVFVEVFLEDFLELCGVCVFVVGDLVVVVCCCYGC